jgi:hypothetical protein
MGTPQGLWNNGHRCDSTSYLPATDGCIFDYGTTTWPINYGGDGMTEGFQTEEVARHIDDAFTNPDATIPAKLDGPKLIPGFRNGPPLVRTRDQNQIDRNRSRSVAECRREWGSDYAQGNAYQCDEYPMASTMQGADTDPNPDSNNFSVRVMPSAENRGAGQYLAWWYGQYRIIDIDAFWVHPVDLE